MGENCEKNKLHSVDIVRIHFVITDIFLLVQRVSSSTSHIFTSIQLSTAVMRVLFTVVFALNKKISILVYGWQILVMHDCLALHHTQK